MQLVLHPQSFSSPLHGSGTCTISNTRGDYWVISYDFTECLETTHHLNGIEFTMELQQKNTFMPSIFDKSLEHRWLIDKVILLAEESCHAAAITLKQAYG